MRIFIAAGGSGGHLFPAIRLAEEIIKQYQYEIIFITSSRQQDISILTEKNIKFKKLPVIGFKSGNIFYILKFAVFLFIAMIKSLYLLLFFKPKVVIGFGSYVSAPVVFLGALCGIKTIIHEQNVYPGKANRAMARVVDKIAVSFPETIQYLKNFQDKILISGNPLRQGLKRQFYNKDKFTILVMGGSHGAGIINKLIPEAIGLIKEDKRCMLEVIHLSGGAEKDNVEKAYKDKGVKSEVFTFRRDMHTVYNKSDFVVSRAGATTVSELMYSAKPSILIPYPHADGHQLLNARVLTDSGGAVLAEEDGLAAEKLRDTLVYMMNRKILKDMFENIQGRGYNNACDILIKEIIGEKRG